MIAALVAVSALPVSIICSTCLGSASPARFCAFQCARSNLSIKIFLPRYVEVRSTLGPRSMMMPAARRLSKVLATIARSDLRCLCSFSRVATCASLASSGLAKDSTLQRHVN